MKIYKSKLGFELIVPLCLLFGFIIFDLISKQAWIGILIFILAISFTVYIFLSIKYKIDKENLNITCTFLVNHNIDIKTISKISETYNPLSSPAASIDRLEIIYNKFDTILISPKNKIEFIENLLAINENIEVVFRNRQIDSK